MRAHSSITFVSYTAAWILVGSWMLTPAVEGAEFRIQTQIFMAKEKAPASEDLMLFKDGVVYDYIVQPREVTVFDPDRRKRFVLLDLDRQVRTSIPTEDVANYLQRMRQVMAKHQKDPVQSFFQNPEFQIGTDPETKELLFASPYPTYRITSIAAKDEIVLRAYFHSANAYAQLNTVTKPGSPPPFPRMAVNDELEKRGLIPTKLELTMRLPGNKPVTIRSEHEVEWKLFAEDRRRIDETQQQLVAFKNVSPEEYLQLPAALQQAQKPAAARAK